jgi:hypothetical protein
MNPRCKPSAGETLSEKPRCAIWQVVQIEELDVPIGGAGVNHCMKKSCWSRTRFYVNFETMLTCKFSFSLDQKARAALAAPR